MRDFEQNRRGNSRNRRRPFWAAGLLCALAISACDGASPDPGLRALVRVQTPHSERGQSVISDLQFVPGPLPDAVSAVQVAQAVTPGMRVWPGLRNVVLSGTLAAGGQSLLIAAPGDIGYFVLPAGSPDDVNFDQLRYDAVLSFSPTLQIGVLPLQLQAVDSAGLGGPIHALPLYVQEDPSTPQGPLVITLRWSSDADLDLRVVTPTLVSGQKARYIEIASRRKSAVQAPDPGSILSEDDVSAAGKLDFDSNAACVLDGRRSENVYWEQAPPRGRYLVRVDTYSMCRQALAVFQVEVRINGKLKYQAAGESTDMDTRFAHDEGAGLLALDFTY